MGRARLPHGSLGGDGPDHAIPPQDVVHGHGTGDRGQPGLVRQDPPNGDVRLAGRLELGPVPRHGRLEVEDTALGEQVDARGRHRLRGEKTN